MSMRKKDVPAKRMPTLAESLGHKGASGAKGAGMDHAKTLFESLKSSGGGKSGKGFSDKQKGNGDVHTEISIPTAGAMKSKVEKQMKGQKVQRMPK